MVTSCWQVCYIACWGKIGAKEHKRKKKCAKKNARNSPPPKKKKKIPGFIHFDHNALRFQDETAIVENVHLRQITRSIIFTRPWSIVQNKNWACTWLSWQKWKITKYETSVCSDEINQIILAIKSTLNIFPVNLIITWSLRIKYNALDNSRIYHTERWI